MAVSISNVGAVLWTPPRNKAGLACKWLPVFTDHIPPEIRCLSLKIHLSGLRRWEQGKGRNTGCLGKKRNALEISWQSGSFLKIPSSTQLLGASDRMLNRQGRGFCIHPGHIQNSVSTAVHQNLLHKAFQLPECTQLTLSYRSVQPRVGKYAG